ncbi:GNAT family N-acetyltransferase [Gorillibacterium timonense]|uniref:GNAT family N-acetyltransferase n=1 Tax=Gorillibacterium timonense TaxID=1689269 RepID=UPI0009E90B30|nr:GNAT family N-acetyltransferase [Gorillibacterium timonense]
MVISLKPVSIENWYACTQLKVKTEQLDVFPAPVVYWIAESKYVDEFEVRAIYSEEELVGFLVFCLQPDKDGNHWIPAIMIDEKHQGKGYGRAAMERLMEWMRLNLSACKKIMIGHRPNNQVAERLYESLGFSKVSEEIVDGEIIRLLKIE